MIKILYRWQSFKYRDYLINLNIVSSRLYSSSRILNVGPRAIENAELDIKLSNLKIHLQQTQKISKSIFLSAIKSIEQTNECTATSALRLLQSCGIHLIELAPHKRQFYLDYLFMSLFRKNLNMRYNMDHYEVYMYTTMLNGGTFCPFEISRLMKVDNLLNPSMGANASLVRRLCELDEIHVALARVVDVLTSSITSQVDLSYYKSQKAIHFDKFVSAVAENSHGTDLSMSHLIDLINPLIRLYLKRNEAGNAIRLFEILVENKIEPNNTTYLNLISGYLISGRLTEARQLFDKSFRNFKLIDCFDLYLEILKAREMCKNEKQQKSSTITTTTTSLDHMTSHLVANLPTTGFVDKHDRIVMVHALMRLCRHGFHQAAFDLVRLLFPSHFTESDPTEYDIINQNINMASYFFKSLVEFTSSVELIGKYACDVRVQCEHTPDRHLKSALYHSLLADKPVEFNLAQIAQIKNLPIAGGEFKRSNALVKLNYFMPLIVAQIRRLDHVMQRVTSLSEVSTHVEFKRLESLIRIIKFEFDCDVSTESLNQILSWLRFDENNEPKPHARFAPLVRLFTSNGFNKQLLFDCCAYKILNYRIAHIRRNRHNKSSLTAFIQPILDDFDDLACLIETLNVNAIETPILDKLNILVKYFLESKSDFVDLSNEGELVANNPVVRTIRLVNQRASSRSLDEINRSIKMYLRLKGDIDDRVLMEELKSNRKNEMASKRKMTVGELEKMIADSKDPDTIRRLIRLICAQPNLVHKPVAYLENLVSSLPDQNSLTPIDCQDLMVFYSKFARDRTKADLYFAKMLEKMRNQKTTTNLSTTTTLRSQIENDEVVEFRPENIVEYVRFLASSGGEKVGIRKIIDVFRQIKPAQPSYTEIDRTRIEQPLYSLLLDHFYANSNASQFHDLVEAMFESGLVDRSERFANLIMTKQIEMNRIDEAFDLYRLYTASHRMSLLEVPMLHAFLNKYAQRKIAKQRLKEVLDTVIGNYELRLAKNIVFFAYIMSNNMTQAYEIFAKQLDFEYDLDFLERLRDQLESVPMLERRYLMHLRKNVLAFNSMYARKNQKHKEIEERVREIFKL